jgi:RNA polymerase sigma-70 factor, ECF subfamily
VTKDSAQSVSFEELLTDEIYQSAWRYALRLASTREDAEDLLQDALTHAWKRIGQLREVNAFKSWLFSIIRTQYLGQIRKRRTQTVSLEDVHIPLPSCDMQMDNELGYALRKLPDSQRELLNLFYSEGLSMKETGMVLGISERAVKLRLFRARSILRKVLMPHRKDLATGLRGVIQDDA